jgi:hypothetical protein
VSTYSDSVPAFLRLLPQTKSHQVRPGGWSQTIRPFSLPYGMDVVLGDVCGGSNSPSMVGVVCLGCAPHLLSVENCSAVTAQACCTLSRLYCGIVHTCSVL